MPSQHTSRSRSRTAAAVLGVIILISGGALVQASGVGIDILAVAVVAGVLLLLDRTVGDWLADRSNSTVPNLLFAGLLAVLVSLLFLTRTGAEWMDKFLKFGEEKGYQGLWIKSHPVAASEPAAAGVTGGTRSTASVGVRTSAAPHHSSRAPSLRMRSSGRGSPDTLPAASTSGSRAVATHADPQGGPTSSRSTGEATTTVVNVTPRSARPGEDVAVRAVVTRAGGRVRSGSVEFSVNGVVHSSASITGDGTASVVLRGLGPGLFSIHARFTGSTDLLPSSSSPVQLTISQNE